MFHSLLFSRYLYKQLLVFFCTDPKARATSIFERRVDGGQLQLKPNIHLHLFSNPPTNPSAENFYFQLSLPLLHVELTKSKVLL